MRKQRAAGLIAIVFFDLLLNRPADWDRLYLSLRICFV